MTGWFCVLAALLHFLHFDSVPLALFAGVALWILAPYDPRVMLQKRMVVIPTETKEDD